MSPGPADMGHGDGTSPGPQTAGTLVSIHLGKAPSGQDGPARAPALETTGATSGREESGLRACGLGEAWDMRALTGSFILIPDSVFQSVK